MTDPKLESALRDAELAAPREFPPAALAALQAAANRLSFPFAHVDLTPARDKDDLLAALALALKLPDWFGHNWDALTDCLSDLSWRPAPGYVIFIEGHDALRAAHPEDFNTLLEIFAETADYWREEDVAFWALFAPPADGTHLLPPMGA